MPAAHPNDQHEPEVPAASPSAPAAVVKKIRSYHQTLANTQAALGPLGGLHPSLQNALEPSEGLFRRLLRPKAGDWLSEHQESGQPFGSYCRRYKDALSRPRAPACNGLLLVPLGSSFRAGVAPRFLEAIAKYCQVFFTNMEVVQAPLVPLEGGQKKGSGPCVDIRKRENPFGDPQYLLEDLFTLLHKDKSVLGAGRRAFCVLGVTMEDIYPGDEWNYVYGQARPMQRVGVFSFARHSPLFYEGIHASEIAPGMLPPAKEARWLQACLRTSTHETGHMLGILHCIYYHCLMNGSNGPGDSAGGTGFLCPVCLRKFLFCLENLSKEGRQVDVKQRYESMRSVLREVLLGAKAGGEGGSEEDEQITMMPMIAGPDGPEESASSCVHPSVAKDLAWLDRRIAALSASQGRQGAAAVTPPSQPSTLLRPQAATPFSRRPSSQASSLGAGPSSSLETARTGEHAETQRPSATEENRRGSNSKSEVGERETAPSSSRSQGYQVNYGARQTWGSGGGHSSRLACREAARLSDPTKSGPMVVGGLSRA